MREVSQTSLKMIKIRILMINFCLGIFLILILFRGYQLHIVENAQVENLALKQYQATLPIEPKRGSIYDRNGHPLAMDVQTISIALHPLQIGDKNKVISELSRILSIPVQKIWPKINSHKKFEWLVRRIDLDKGNEVANLKLKGVSTVSEYRRFYPNKELAGNVLGAVGYDAKALGGLELSLDSFLKSSSSRVVASRDAKGRLYTSIENQETNHNVYLTLDMNLQFIAEKYLWETGKKYKAASGFAMIANPRTGELLAVANYPSFNPNVYWEYAQASWKNHAFIDSFEPGSTFKPFIVAAGLESHKIKIGDKFYCENGNYKVGNRVIRDHNPYGTLTLGEIVKYSSNIGVTKIGEKVGKDFFYKTMIDFGFSQASGLGYPLESSGFVPHKSKWKEIDRSNMAFGQGLTVNGLQMLKAYSTLASEGNLMRPILVGRVTAVAGDVVLENKPIVERQVVSSDVAKSLSSMLIDVVGAGTGRLAAIEGFSVAGKTGTAQKVNPKTRTYDEHNYVSSFIGYIPAKKPEYVIYVVYDSPQPIHTGGAVAAPVFKGIAQEALAYKGLMREEIKLANRSFSQDMSRDVTVVDHTVVDQ